MRKIISLLIVCLMLMTSFVGFSSSLSKASNPQKTLVHEQNYIVITSGQTHDPAPLPVNSSWWDANWTYRKEITINHTKVSANLTNFPVLVSIVDSDLEAHAQTNGNDIMFILYSDNTTKLNHEIETYTSSTGTLVAWVNVTSLSSTVDTKIWMYYGNPFCGSQQNRVGTWDANYLMVQHLNDSTTSKTIDSTSNGNTGTKKAANTPIQITGKIGYGQYFDTTDYIDCGTNVKLGTSPYTISAYATFSDATRNSGYVMGKVGYNMGLQQNLRTIIFRTRNSTNAVFFVQTSNIVIAGVWYYITGVYDSSGYINLYVNDTYIGQTHVLGSIKNYDSVGTFIGDTMAGGEPQYGNVDEVRISNIDRSASYIKTTYNTTSSPSTFLYEGRQMDDIAPTFSGESPTNSTTNVSLTPTCAITINDADGELMNVYWLENSSGSWILRQTNTSCSNGTYSWIFTQASAYSTKYWWKVTCNDTEGNTISAWYCFTTRAEHNPLISNPSPVNGSTGISLTPNTNITITDPDGDTMTLDWFTNASGSWVNYGDNTSVGNGTYRQTASWASDYETKYWWKVAVNDTYLTSTAMFDFMTASPPNQPPYTPSNPFPANGTTGVSVTPTLSWTGGDPDGDPVTYDVYFGTSSPPPKQVSNQSDLTYAPGTLLFDTLYYWRIIAWDNHSASTTGPLWHFTTGTQPNQPPYVPSAPSPVNDSMNISINVDVGWTGGDPDGDPVTYNVYFGTTSPPPLVMSNQSALSYDPGTLSYNTLYYWRIVAWDNHGASTEGPLWHFTTGTQPNQPPYAPSNPSPANGSKEVPLNLNLSWTCSDPDGDPITYDVYFGGSSPLTKITSNTSETSCAVEHLNYSMKYYWKVVAWDTHHNTNTSPLWVFTTTNDTFPPSLAITSPKKGYLYVNVAGGKIQLEFPIGITTLVIGQVEVNTKVSDNQSGVGRVEFYIDNILKATDYTPPFNWTWSEHGYLFPYLLTITAYDNVGNPSTSSIRVWKIF